MILVNEETFFRILEMSQGNAAGLRRIFNSCWARYMEYLSEIASDIYDSCIQEYYRFRPKVYDRHGYPEGANLYRANKIGYSADDIILNINEWSLWQYNGREKRQRVLDTVMQGIRGGGARTRQFAGWPQDWDTSYPNSYSQYGSVWSSNGSTMYEIFDDFLATALSSTQDYFIDMFYNSI